MQSQSRVVIIGGGVVGCSILYHLARAGWRDVVLLERSELTAGSSWHAAGGYHALNSDRNIAALHAYTIRLYRELEKETGLSCGMQQHGGLTLANSPERMDHIRSERAKHQYFGIDMEVLGPKEIEALCPGMDCTGVLGALWDPLDGHLDPIATTHVYAAAAKMHGATIQEGCEVLSLEQRKDASWLVKTTQGEILAEHVVNAAGLWARELGAMVGVYHPMQPMEHQFLITKPIDEVKAWEREHPLVLDPLGQTYFRQDGDGLCIGFYETGCHAWSVDGTPLDFGMRLLEEDPARYAESMAFAERRYPLLKDAEVDRIVNGPFCFAPDGNPLVGPVPELPGYWAAAGVMAGFCVGGGIGLTLAEWIIDGEPGQDVSAMDVARFGNYCTRPYVKAKAIQVYENRFAVPYPNQQLLAGRPLRSSPLHAVWEQHNARFTEVYGMEVPRYFAESASEPDDDASFRRSRSFDRVADECRAVREGVGFTDLFPVAKFDVSGRNAAVALGSLLRNPLPEIGRIGFNQVLSSRDKILADFTIVRLAEDEFRLFAAFSAQAHIQRLLQPLSGQDVQIDNVSEEIGGLLIAGPHARELLSRLTDADVSIDALPYLSARELPLKQLSALVLRCSATGDLAYEVYVPVNQQFALYQLLNECGAEFNLKPFGLEALNSLRLEKSYGAWLKELRPDYTAAELGLDEGKRSRALHTLIIETEDADAAGDEPVYAGEHCVGFVSSGGFGHSVQLSIALAIIDLPVEGPLTVEILGKRYPAKIVDGCLYDPDERRLRS